jgi:hypothetical protein
VNISFNQNLLKKTIYKIYKDDFIENNGLESLDIIKNCLIKNSEFYKLMNLTLMEFIIKKYWNSEFHKKKLTEIFEKESYEYYLNYEFYDKEFINYFLSNKGNKRKIDKKNYNMNNENNSNNINNINNDYDLMDITVSYTSN